MALAPEEFIRRFLLHVLPAGFHRIRHYGLLANAGRRENLARARALLQVETAAPEEPEGVPGNPHPTFICPHCGAPMMVVEVLLRRHLIRAPPIIGRPP